MRTLTVTALIALLLGACGGSLTEPNQRAGETTRGWLSTTMESAVFLRWTESSSGEISGVIQLARLDGSSVEGESSAVSGSTSSDVITLSIDGLFDLDSTITGEEKDGEVTLYWPNDRGLLEPLVFEQGTIADYNDVVADLESLSVERAEAADEAQVAAEQAQADADALAAADDQLARAASDLQSAIQDMGNAEEWAGYALEGAQDTLDALRSDVAELEDTVQTDPFYAEADLEVAEWTYGTLQLDVEYALSVDALGVIENAIAGLNSRIADVTAALDDVRWAEDLYLNNEFAPYNAAAELALIEEAQHIVDETGPSSIESFKLQANALLDEGTSLIVTARALVSGE